MLALLRCYFFIISILLSDYGYVYKLEIFIVLSAIGKWATLLLKSFLHYHQHLHFMEDLNGPLLVNRKVETLK